MLHGALSKVAASSSSNKMAPNGRANEASDKRSDAEKEASSVREEDGLDDHWDVREAEQAQHIRMLKK